MFPNISINSFQLYQKHFVIVVILTTVSGSLKDDSLTKL